MDDLSSQAQPEKKILGADFLLSIAGQGRSGETDVSERVEDILAAEVDPIRGWWRNDTEYNVSEIWQYNIDDEVGK